MRIFDDCIYFDIDEVSRFAGVCRATAENWIRSGKLAAPARREISEKRRGTAVRYWKWEQVEEYIPENVRHVYESRAEFLKGYAGIDLAPYKAWRDGEVDRLIIQASKLAPRSFNSATYDPNGDAVYNLLTDAREALSALPESALPIYLEATGRVGEVEGAG